MNSHPDLPNLQGQLLLADPSLRDGNFHKSVILLADHNETEGAFGLILNCPSGQTVGDLLPDSKFTHLAKVAVHVGGPVGRDQITFGAFWKKKDSSDLGFAVRISAEEAAAYHQQPGILVRAFAGYSGWSKSQLEDEVQQQAWSLTTPTSALIEEKHNATLWKSLMSQLSPYHRILADIPDQILAN